MGNPVTDPISAPDLGGFASREWIGGMLDPERISSLHYLGGTKFKAGKMVRFVKRDIANYDEGQKESLRKVILALSAEANLPGQRAVEKLDATLIMEGRNLLKSEAMRCTECHSFGKPNEDATAPDLTGYGSRQWLIELISDPSHVRFYGSRNDRMPSFGQDKILDRQSLELLADWLRNDYYQP